MNRLVILCSKIRRNSLCSATDGPVTGNTSHAFGYGLNYLIDIENTVIVDVEATPARTYDEVAAPKP